MDTENIDFIKWFIAIPGALLATITIPWVIRKYHLECKKLRLEISKLQEELGIDKKSSKMPGTIFTWFANYWPIPCYGSLAVLIPIGAATKSGWVFVIAFSLSFIFFISGSVINERYEEIKKDIIKNS